MLVLAVSEDFDKLLQNCSLAAVTSLRILRRVVIVAVDLSFVFIVAVLSAKDCRAYRAGKMLDMVFSIKCGDVRSTKRTSAFET